MRAPRWHEWLMLPLAILRVWLMRARQRRAAAATAPEARPGPVIAVQSPYARHSETAPAVIALAQHLMAGGRSVQVVVASGRECAEPLRVDERRHSATELGDDALLIAAFAPVWVAREAMAAIRAARAAGADVVLLAGGDVTGLADFTVLAVDADQGLGNGLPWPAGPLRDNAGACLAQADAVLLAGGSGAVPAALAGRWPALRKRPIVAGRMQVLETGMPWEGLRVLAFSGLAAPAAFLASLRALRVELVRAEALDPRRPLGPALMKRLEMEAKARGAQLVTTEKDAARLPPGFRPKVLTLPLRLVVEDWAALDAVLAPVLGAASPPRP